MFTTKAINQKMEQDPIFSLFVFESLLRFVSGDWGDITEESAAANNADPDFATAYYTDANGVKICIKSIEPAIIVLFPNED